MTKEEVYQQCVVEGNIVKLPNMQLDRKLYLEVKNGLELIGGKWKGGKTYGFVFAEDPSELLTMIANGEKKNLKKEYQFFETPDSLADQLVRLANISPVVLDDFKILEPSAGQGAIIKAIHRVCKDQVVDAIELMEINYSILCKMQNVDAVLGNFLDFLPLFHPHMRFNRIIANPPFTKNQDIDHVLRMYEFLDVNGILVSVMSESWLNGSQKKHEFFKEWLFNKVQGTVMDIPRGTFKDSGTMVGGTIVVIEK